MVHRLGYAPENYSLISYGGGPLHAAGYTKPLKFKDVLVPDWAATFSAFGTACADSAYRYDQSVDIILQPGFSNAGEVAEVMTGVFHKLREKAVGAFERDDIDPEEMEFHPAIRAQYTGMLDDLEVQVEEFWDGGLTGADIEEVVEKFEEEFGRVLQRAARSPENASSPSPSARVSRHRRSRRSPTRSQCRPRHRPSRPTRASGRSTGRASGTMPTSGTWPTSTRGTSSRNRQ